ncbi:hypothetical protein OsJ_14603 [Oryza sativa Japonica Group]|uniref:Uncharacterized protein n=1 Tax=Oryza sativa subsp. japonica TaxID=39947 RepID=B9FEX3_ORYSJ|nr:hypothetical protein OsJ_14603 [Oryza sativa Japonica Group]
MARWTLRLLLWVLAFGVILSQLLRYATIFALAFGFGDGSRRRTLSSASSLPPPWRPSSSPISAERSRRQRRRLPPPRRAPPGSSTRGMAVGTRLPAPPTKGAAEGSGESDAAALVAAVVAPPLRRGG